jgi:ABC-type molybdate transport system substrate-binding protein
MERWKNLGGMIPQRYISISSGAAAIVFAAGSLKCPWPELEAAKYVSIFVWR